MSTNHSILPRWIFRNPISKALRRTSSNWFLKLAGQALAIDSQNIDRCLQLRALQESADFVQNHLQEAKSFPDARSLLTSCLALSSPETGDLVCEFGVHTGGTINVIAGHTKGIVHGFDSFEGLPERWRDKFEKGAFALAELPKVERNVNLIKGWFDATLPAFLKEYPGNVSFLHIDCDLYSSTSTVFRLLGGRITKGTVLVFDEFFNYPNWREGEYKAFSEFVAEKKCGYRFLGYCATGEQVAVEITSLIDDQESLKS